MQTAKKDKDRSGGGAITYVHWRFVQLFAEAPPALCELKRENLADLANIDEPTISEGLPFVARETKIGNLLHVLVGHLASLGHKNDQRAQLLWRQAGDRINNRHFASFPCG